MARRALLHDGHRELEVWVPERRWDPDCQDGLCVNSMATRTLLRIREAGLVPDSTRPHINPSWAMQAVETELAVRQEAGRLDRILKPEKGV